MPQSSLNVFHKFNNPLNINHITKRMNIQADEYVNDDVKSIP